MPNVLRRYASSESRFDRPSSQVDDELFSKDGRSANEAYLQPDLEAMVERKRKLFGERK